MFTKLATVLAWFLLVTGILAAITGLGIAMSDDHVALAKRYYGNRSTGVVIDQGLYCVAAGIAFGVVAEISKSFQKLVKQNNSKES